jgi:penicillin-binding protein 1C
VKGLGHAARSLRRRRRPLGAFLFVLALFAIALRIGPLPDGLLDPVAESSTVVVDRQGRPLYEARSASGMRTAPIAADQLPAHVVAATLAAEDHRFYDHIGIDPIALLRAAYRNVTSGRVVEGGSTITQQTAKLLLERTARRPRSRSVAAKLEEALIALRLEHHLEKDRILALYLSLAPYGNQIAGIGRASGMYFGVAPERLTLAQAAFLAGLPQRPTAYNPYRDPRAAAARQQAILDRLRRDGAFAHAEIERARRERLRVSPPEGAFVAPHFVEMVLARSRTRQGRLETTLDADLQQEVAGILRAQRAGLERHGAHNVAVVVLDNRRGEWLAWEGSGDYHATDAGGAIDGVLALRQPGSALKPFVYALGFESGATPATLLADIPSAYPTAQPGVVYTPRNYDGRFHGPLRARLALAGSQNVPAVALAARVGPPALLGFLRRLGFSSLDRTAAHYGLGVALGNAEVPLAELVGAYAALARGGVYQTPRALLSEPPSLPVRMMTDRAAFWVSDVLADAEARAYVFGRGGDLEFPFPVAVKTGTSQAYHDNWTIGYTRDVTVGVWVGNFDRRPLTGASGVTGAGPIFHAVMLAAQRHVGGNEAPDAPLVQPSGDLRESVVCELSGMPAGAACPRRVREWLPADSVHVPCSWHHHSEEGLLTLWPDEYRQWAAAHGLLDGEPARVTPAVGTRDDERRVPAATTRAAPFAIVSPPDGATYLIDPTLRREYQALPLRATAATGRVEWRVNGQLIGSTTGTRALQWPLERGEHVVTARDRRGQAADVTILVK